MKAIRSRNSWSHLCHGDWTQLLSELENALDRAVVVEGRRHGAAKAVQAARCNYLSAREARRLLDGESPVRVWRENRGRSQRELAAAASVGAGYLPEIETGREPGSMLALARALRVQIGDLILSPNGWEPASKRVAGTRRPTRCTAFVCPWLIKRSALPYFLTFNARRYTLSG